MNVDSVDTPALLLDLDKVERNLDKMAALFASRRVKLRPHAKTHKTVTVAQMQLDRGAIGICVAKLAEAETLAAGGINDILITTEIIGAEKLWRLMALAAKSHPIVVVDDAASARAMSDRAVSSRLKIDVLVDIDVGQHRTGVQAANAVNLGKIVASLPGLNLRGLQGYEGHIQHVTEPEARKAANAAAMTILCAAAADFKAAGLSTEIVTTGGTGTGIFAAEYDAITDVQPGSYVVMDAQYGDVEGVEFENALTLLTSVISVNDTWAVVDAGHKSLSSDAGLPRALGLDATYALAGDEHGKLNYAGTPSVTIGEKVHIIPSHCDTTINLHDEYVMHRSGTLIARWPIVNRGRTR